MGKSEFLEDRKGFWEFPGGKDYMYVILFSFDLEGSNIFVLICVLFLY